MENRGTSNSGKTTASRGAASPDGRDGRPFFWRVGDGVLYAEMHFSRAIRPPLLTEWESIRVRAFRSKERRARWLASRALAKALVRERFGVSGIVEIREGSDGEPLLYRNGLPVPGVWLGMSCRAGRVAAVIADRPVALDLRPVRDHEHELVERLVSRADARHLRRVLGSPDLARVVAWSAKEAAGRAVRTTRDLAGIEVASDLGLRVGDSMLQLMAVRTFDDSVVTIVGKQLLAERPVVRIVLQGNPPAEQPATSQAALDRSAARARRISDARSRWQQRLRWA